MRTSTVIGSLVGSGLSVGVGLIWLSDSNARTSTHDRDTMVRGMLAGVGVFATGYLSAAVLNLRMVQGNAGRGQPFSRAAPILSLVGTSAMVAGIASRRGVVVLPGAALAALPMWGQPRRLRRAWAAAVRWDRSALVVLPHVDLAPGRGSLNVAAAW